MSNQEFDSQSYPLFVQEKAFENYAEDEEFMLSQLKSGIKAFDRGGPIDKVIEQYLQFDWSVVGSKEWSNFKMAAHSLKGRFRYMGADRLEKQFEKLQSAIQDAKTIQVGMRMEGMLRVCQPTHTTILQFLKMPIEDIYMYDAQKICQCCNIHQNYLKMNLNYNSHEIVPSKSKMFCQYLAGTNNLPKNDDQRDNSNEVICSIF